MEVRKLIEDFSISNKYFLNAETFVLELKHTNMLPPIAPGQFVEVAVENAPHTFLRRPLSIHHVDYENNIISLFVKIVGEGTRKLSLLQIQDKVNMIYPLGRGFTLEHKKKVLLTGGGCGIAPLLYLADKLKENLCEVDILLAGKSSNDILRADAYKKFGHLLITTEDGSLGEKGLIIQHSVFKNNLQKYARIYSCGPERMMQAVARLAKAAKIPSEVSLENTMACGIGACLCCVVNTKNGHQCVCTEGPVFDSSELEDFQK